MKPKTILAVFLAALFFLACTRENKTINQKEHKEMKRVGMVVKIKKDRLEEYRKLHADGNPGVRHLLTKYNMRNFSIFLIQLSKQG